MITDSSLVTIGNLIKEPKRNIQLYLINNMVPVRKCYEQKDIRVIALVIIM